MNQLQAIAYLWSVQDNIPREQRCELMWNLTCHILEHTDDTIFSEKEIDKWLNIKED